MRKTPIPWPGPLAFLVSMGLVVALYLNALEAERVNTRLDFEQAAAIRVNALNTEVQGVVEVLQLISHHLELTDGSDLPGFRYYTQPMLEQHPYLQAVGYNPRVALAERAAFERQAGRAWPGFQITEASQPGTFRSAAERGEYFPFLYAEPVASNGAAIGFDVATETRPDPHFPRLAAMRTALADKGMAVSAPVALVLRRPSGETGVVAFSPLYRGAEHAREQLFGFATLVIRVGDMLQWSQRMAAARGWKNVDLVLQDVSGPTPVDMYGKLPALLPALSYEQTFDIPGQRKWRVVALPVGNAFDLAPGKAARILLLVGVALSVLLAFLAHVLAGKAEAIRRQVREQTVDLAAANSRLTASEARLREISALQKSVLANAGYAIIASDNDGIIQVFNPAAERMLGYRANEVIGQARPSLFHEPQATLQYDSDGAKFRALVAPLENLSPGTPYDQELSYWNRAGQELPVMLSLACMVDDDGKRVGYMGIAHDISSRKAAEAHISRLAHYDTLTDLPNRLQLRKELRRAIAAARRGGQRLGVMFVDLDRFKNINDSLGHFVGDRLLQAIASRLQTSLREGDVVARMGGDEFVVLLNNLERPDLAAEVASRMLAEVGTPVVIDGQTLTVTPSIGIALYPGDGTDGNSLIQNADTAMYSAKDQGRNCYRFFTRSMNEQVSARLAMESRIRHALQEGNFLLYYQPQFDAASGRLVGAEALIRMQDAEGFLTPGHFISVAEESGLILPLGDWVLGEAIRRNRDWLAAGLAVVPIAVNVSARQFEQADFADRVAARLHDAGLDSGWLEIELTESIVMQSVDKTLDALRALKAQGLSIAIDDFGTGFSSLAYLKRFPIDRLKVDRSFVEGLEQENASIVQTIIGLAHQLKLEVVAEGVETTAQADLLRAWGCNIFQGYLFGRPLPAEQFEALLRR